MGAGDFHGRVRDGIGCRLPAKATRSSKLSLTVRQSLIADIRDAAPALHHEVPAAAKVLVQRDV